MRLLSCSADDEYRLTEFDEDAIPPYAILSHTWLAEEEEPSYKDLNDRTGRKKLGYRKLRFCAEQAKHDGLQYFWVDTCCIDKSNRAELSHSINSMFRWYRRAARCYVHLWDVSTTGQEINNASKLRRKLASQSKKWLMKRNASESPPSNSVWEPAFRASRWFTRGWTLQELLAPLSVDFFSKEGKRLGNKISLQRQIHEITAIPELALRGALLSQFTVPDRLSWIEGRQTKRNEDKAYSLLGIFGVHMAPLYGEGMAAAFRRLQDELDKMDKCIQDLHITNPNLDKKRIEDSKGGLLKDSYRWVLSNTEFQRWHNDRESHLLWVRGDPGKGKTMLLCGIINELSKSADKSSLLAYFFCQATDARINNATAVLQGLLYMLISQQPSLLSHVRKRYDHVGQGLFINTNAWFTLTEIFADLLHDPMLSGTYFVIDALDECVEGLSKLLTFIIQASSARVKWIVSSRNWPYIEERLENAGQNINLELNAESVSTAVNYFIKYRVNQLAQQKAYDDEIRDKVLYHLSSNADNTFLWVALVCQKLEQTPRGRTLAKLVDFPPGLDELYSRMMEQILRMDKDDVIVCKRVLATLALTYRPLTLKELAVIVEGIQDMINDLASLREFIGLCGSLLALREDTVYFVHQSAKDYLIECAYDEIFPLGPEQVHHTIFSKSLQTLSNSLRRNIYCLQTLGYQIDQIKPPHPDPLAASRYSCIHWVDHLYESTANSAANRELFLQCGRAVNVFLKDKYLYWLEALSLCKAISDGVISMAKLEALFQGREELSSLLQLIHDARRFILYFKRAIEQSPLQVYTSGLVFSPSRSIIKAQFEDEAPKWIITKPAVEENWNACLQTLEGHGEPVTSVVFLYDGTRLASGSYDKTVKIWDASSSACLQTLKGHGRPVTSVVFSRDGTRLASGSYDMMVKIWDASSGACLQTLKGHGSSVFSVVFSRDGTRLASGSDDMTVKIWDASSGACLQTLKGHSSSVFSVVFSRDGTRLASGSYDMTVKIWDASSGACLQTLEGHGSPVFSVVFSRDGTRLASGSGDKTVKIWDASSGVCLQTLEAGKVLFNIAFDHTGSYLLTAIGPLVLATASSSLSALSSLDLMSIAKPQIPRFRDWGISVDGEWITCNSEHRLWLPPEYRPSRLAFLGQLIGVGVSTGKVWICGFEADTM